jgi:hypothetical protein
MLDTIEQRVTAIVGEALSQRPHLAVVAAPAPPEAIAAGQGRVIVSLGEIASSGVFQRDEMQLARKSPPLSRRVVPLDFSLDVRLRERPSADSAAARRSTRTQLLRDLALVVHALALGTIRSGTSLKPGTGDPGFDVATFALDGGKVSPELDGDGMLNAELRYKGTAEIWPPDVTSEEGEIRDLDIVLIAQPLAFEAVPARIAAGGTSRIRVHGIAGDRLPKRGDARQPLQVAVRVVSDLPPAARGTVTSGTAAVETGVRLVPVGPEGEVEIVYRAPAALDGVSVEFVAVHLATREGGRGPLLGTAPVALKREGE